MSLWSDLGSETRGQRVHANLSRKDIGLAPLTTPPDFVIILSYISSWADAHANLPLPGKVDR